MKVAIKAVLWRRVLAATIDTLTDKSGGQYHISIPRLEDLAKFVEPLPKSKLTDLGGFEVVLPVAAFEGVNPVPAQELTLRFMGLKSQRKDWGIPSQRSDTAYPLWRPGRAFPANDPPRPGADTILLVRDETDQYHARWLDRASVEVLPQPLRDLVEKSEVGIWWNQMASSSSAQRVFRALLTHRNVLLYGPPGTGKTRLLQEVQSLFQSSQLELETTEEREPIQGSSASPSRVAFVTFHQSFGYEDFVVGLRPDPGVTDKLLALRPTPGILLELSEFARVRGQRSLLLIDEINRGNASRIFGELVTLLDADKRLAEDGSDRPQTVKLRLPYQVSSHPIKVEIDGKAVPVPSPFSMPNHVYLLATMNSVDKSVAPLDAALRRRFHVERLGPKYDEVCTALGVAMPTPQFSVKDSGLTLEEFKQLAVLLLQSLNEGIAAFLGDDFQFGHWLLAPLIGSRTADEAKSGICELWENRLFPQLEEFFQGRPDQFQAVLRSPKASDPLNWRSARPELEEAGANSVLERRVVDRDEMIRFLCRVAGAKVSP